MIENILEELKYDKLLCKLDRGYDDAVDYGTIENFNKEIVCIKRYDSDGFYDGIKIFWIDDIENIIWSGNNLDARKQFILKHGINHDPINIKINSFNEFMESATKIFGYVRINNEQEEVSYVGPIVEYNEKYIHILNFGNPSRRDKENVLIKKENIHSIEVDGIYERNLIDIHANKQA